MEAASDQPGLYPKGEVLGKFAIFYHQNTEGHEPLEGAKIDAEILENTAKGLGFDVDELHINMNCDQLLAKLDYYAKMDHTNSSCFAVAIFGHGGENDFLAASDCGRYKLSVVFDKFRADEDSCPTLKDKPKLFFINACRGEMDHMGVPEAFVGTSVESETKILTIPVEKDFLVVHSVVPDYKAYYWATDGSPFIQSLCTVLENKDDILDILTIVNDSASQISYDRKYPQMSSFTSQLAALWYLRDPPDSSHLSPEISYKMDNPKRGNFYIFSNSRNDDVKLLHNFGTRWGFNASHHALNEMIDTANQYVEAGHTDHDCVVSVIITYSEDHDVLYVGENETLELKEFVKKFHADQCPALHGRPKIFIVQAPYAVVASGNGRENAVHTIPETADTLIVYSTSPEKHGSRTLFIEALCKYLEPKPDGVDLLKALTMVTERMSQVVGLHVPSVTSQLRQKVVFK